MSGETAANSSKPHLTFWRRTMLKTNVTPSVCVACGGTGLDSKGGKCYPCQVRSTADAAAPAAAKPTKAPKAPKAEKVEKPTKANPPAAKKTGLRTPQVRILTCLAKAKTALTRKEISEKAPVDLAFCTEYVGSNDPERRAKNDLKFPSLITLGHVKAEQHDVDGKDVIRYSITAKGRKALEKAE